MINVSKVVEEYARLHQTAMLVFDPPLMDSPALKSDALLFQAMTPAPRDCMHPTSRLTTTSARLSS